MEIRRVGRKNAQLAEGVVVVIDVIRAFSVAAYAFAGDAKAIWMVRTVEEAFALRQDARDILEDATETPLLIGEVKGRLVPGFDLNNSPTMMQATDVKGRYLIQRTGAGTQGAVGANNAQSLLVCSLVNAEATAAYAKEEMARTGQNVLTLVPTGTTEGYDEQPNEDVACSDYLQALLEDRAEAREELDQSLARLRDAGRFEIFKDVDGDFPAGDRAAVLHIDIFQFVMVGKRRHSHSVEFVEVKKRQ